MSEQKNNQMPVAPMQTVAQPMASQHLVDKMKSESLSFFNPQVWEGINLMAKVFANSGALPKSLDTTAKIIMALQAGKEAGMQPLEALSSFAPINGKMTMYGNAVIAQVAKAGHSIRWGKCDENEATVTIKRCDTGEEMTERYTLDDARRAKLADRDVWKAYPRRMLKYKAFAEVANFLVPDALKGVVMKEIIESEDYPVIEPKTVIPAAGLVMSGPQLPTGHENQVVVPGKVETTTPAMPSLDEALAAGAPIEEMPPAPVTKDETRGEKIMRKAKEDKKVKDNAWPGDVCRLVRFLTTIDGDMLSREMTELKQDAVKGEWKGYDAYPSIRVEIARIPSDFE